MREFCIGKNSINTENGVLHCDYLILIDETGGNIPCERYGIKVLMLESGESAEICDITLDSERIMALGDLLCRNGVTPCTLPDVVADWL